MRDIIGGIGPQVEITETAEFDAPTRTVNLTDAAGRLHGRIQWLSEDIDEGFDRALLQLWVEATGCPALPTRSPSAAS
jgi:hypothetical protein